MYDFHKSLFLFYLFVSPIRKMLRLQGKTKKTRRSESDFYARFLYYIFNFTTEITSTDHSAFLHFLEANYNKSQIILQHY